MPVFVLTCQNEMEASVDGPSFPFPPNPFRISDSILTGCRRLTQRKDRNLKVLGLLLSPLIILAFVLNGSSGFLYFHHGYDQVRIGVTRLTHARHQFVIITP
jgi:hypothetical protein